MARLYRPHIPLSVRCAVALRQINEIWPDHPSPPSLRTTRFGRLLKARLSALKSGLGVTDLQLDHDPPLGARRKVFKDGMHADYDPPANSPDHLIYREAGAHRLKTNVRGEHGQHPDRVLIKKARRIERGPRPKRGPKIQSRGFDKKSRLFQKRRKS
jgi:hypothetical protein